MFNPNPLTHNNIELTPDTQATTFVENANNAQLFPKFSKLNNSTSLVFDSNSLESNFDLTAVDSSSWQTAQSFTNNDITGEFKRQPENFIFHPQSSKDTIQVSSVEPQPTNSFKVARDLGILNGEQKLSGFVGNDRKDEIYRFALDRKSNFSLVLDGLKDDADVEIIEDKNNNGVLDNGEIFRKSNESDTVREEIQSWGMNAGTYYVRVTQFSGNTPYNLNLTARPFSSPPDTAGNNFKEARDLGVLKGTESLREYLWAGDPDDRYRFRLDEPSSFALAIGDLTSTVDVEVIQDKNNNGFIDEDEMLRRDYTEGIGRKELQFWRLEAGTYYIRTAYEYPGATGYGLTLVATPALTPPPDSSGNTLKEARDLGAIDGSVTLNDSVWFGDRNDFYRLRLDNTQDFSLQLASLNGDAEIQLLQDNNGNGLVEESEILRESATGTDSQGKIKFWGLQPGNYYVGVTPKNRDTNYNLSLSATPAIGFNSDYGYGLVNAAAAVTGASGADIFYSENITPTGNDAGRQLVRAPEVWDRGYTGQGVTVAVLDTGVDYNHPDLADNIWINSREIPGNGIDDDGNGFVDDIRGWDFVDNDSNPMDELEHGTHVAGIVAAEKNDVGITGVAYNAKIMPVRIADRAGSASARNFIAGIRYAVDNGAKIINLSLGGSSPNRDRAEALNYATSKGVVLVMASGNSGETEPAYPARYAEQWGIAVGAVKIDRKLANLSNRAGSTPMTFVVAPGVDILSTVLNNEYKSLTGTSMATPHVTGVIALMLSANPSLTPDQIKKILTSTTSRS